MGLYIKNLKMSEHCMDCPFMVSRDNDDCILQSDEANENFESLEQMKAGCPLIEVPEPHGRLGDLDALAKQVEHERFHHAHTDGLAARHHVAEYGNFLKAISAAPTIIQASEVSE